MKIEQVSADKVRVRLSHEELAEMNVNPEMFMSDSKALNAFILNILHEIYETTDFDPFYGSITMEAMPDSDGMCIMLSKGIVPKSAKKTGYSVDLERIAELLGIDTRTQKKPQKRKIKSVSAVKEGSARGIHTFIFNEFDDMCSAAGRMSTVTAQLSELYKIDGKYAMLVPILTKTLDDFAMIMEFASEVKRGLAYEHVREHGELIAKNESLVNMAEGIRGLETRVES